MADGKPLSHWASEARQTSFFSFWNSTKDERRRLAFTRLAEIGEPAVPALVKLLKTDNPSVSGDALNTLASLGPRARSATTELLEMLPSGSADHRVAAMTILSAIGPEAEVAVPAMARALSDADPRVSWVAAMSLAKMGHAGQAALGEAVRSPDVGVRQSAMSGMSGVLRTPKDTREFVMTALADTDPAVRAAGVALLGDRRGAADEFVDLLIRAMNDSSVMVGDAARRVFHAARQNGASPRLFAVVMIEGDVGSRADAAWQIGNMLRHPIDRMGVPTAMKGEIRDGLNHALEDSDSKVRMYAARAFAAGYPDSHTRVAARLRKEIPKAEVEVGVRGASVLWELNRDLEEVEPAFTRGLAAKDRWVRVEALGEILKMGAAAEPLLPAIERLRADPSRDVSERADRTAEFIRRAVAQPPSVRPP